jgi:hypothetical protein
VPHLTDLPFKLSYRTGRDDLVRDFFVPCLEAAVLYRRAAGYFTSAGLALAARGVASLALRRGRMRLVVSPHLEADDIAALERAKENPAGALRSIAARTLAEIEDALVKDRLNALAWLAAARLLEIKLAIRVSAQGGYSRGLFHAKTGVFSDDAGNHVSFSGSANETAGGLVENFEHLDVFRSWQDQEGRVQAAIDDFEALWTGSTPGLRVFEFSQAGQDLLERYRNPDRPPPGIDPDQIREPGSSRTLTPYIGLELRTYQKDAIRAWSKAGGRGVFAMATGSGKTFTALVLASKVAERTRPLVLVVVCPFINLCRQWIREVATFGVDPVPCFEGRQRWQVRLEEGYQRLAAGLDQVLVIVATNATFQSDAFQCRLRPRVDAGNLHHLLIADEVHNLGADQARSALPDGIALRLGLSATPERHFDPAGTAAVLDYFGPIVYQYTLSPAIADGRLGRYQTQRACSSTRSTGSGLMANCGHDHGSSTAMASVAPEWLQGFALRLGEARPATFSGGSPGCESGRGESGTGASRASRGKTTITSGDPALTTAEPVVTGAPVCGYSGSISSAGQRSSAGSTSAGSTVLNRKRARVCIPSSAS